MWCTPRPRKDCLSITKLGRLYTRRRSMAGSYNHVVTDDGNLRSNERVLQSLENGGDVCEAVEEMYGMIWFLAHQSVAAHVPPHLLKSFEFSRESMKDVVNI